MTCVFCQRTKPVQKQTEQKQMILDLPTGKLLAALPRLQIAHDYENVLLFLTPAIRATVTFDSRLPSSTFPKTIVPRASQLFSG